MADDPGRPRLTWYGPVHERIELSAKTLANWVAKTANLLVDELGAEPGTRIGIGLPAHWRTVVWLLATWSAGAHAVVIPPAQEVEVLVTERPGSGVAQVSARAGAQLVAVALPALATRFGDVLPAGAIDAATEVRAMGDHFVPMHEPDADDPAFTANGVQLSYAELFAAGTAPRTRLLTSAGAAHAQHAYLAPLITNGSIVLHGGADAGLDAAAVAKIAVQEGTTAAYG